MQNWSLENKRKLFAKMQNKGIMRGGIFKTHDENINLFNYLKGI